MTLNPKRLPNYLPLTVLLLMVLATLGALWGAAVVTGSLVSSAFLLGPLALVTTVPVAMAVASLGNLIALFVTPVWAVVGGWLFGAKKTNAAATNGNHPLGVTLFSDTHPIHQHLNHFGQQLGLPRIKWVGWFEDERINAFAMGMKQDEALIAFSSGAVRTLSKEELQAVMVHELAHVANHDMARMTYGISVQEALTWFLGLRGLKLFARCVFTPLSELELLRMSRSREYWADAIGAYLVGPDAMAGALRKIENQPSRGKQYKGFSHFMFQANADGLLSTHPPLAKRIAAIEQSTYVKRLPELTPRDSIPALAE
ncbi:MAG: M48 family metalloprotease [Hyphomicrobiales bacterium]